MDKLNKKSKSTATLILNLWKHFSKKRKKQIGLLFIIMIASGLSEVFSLASILPFLAVLSNPNKFWEIDLVRSISYNFGITSPDELLLPTTIIFISATLLAGSTRLINLWLNGRLAAAIGSDLSCEAYGNTLYQPYSFHMQVNSSAIIASTTTQINHTVWAINLALQLFTSIIVVIGLLVTWLLIEWEIATTIAIVFLSTYYLIALNVREKLSKNSILIDLTTKAQLKALQEGLGAIRDILLDRNQIFYQKVYRKADVPMRRKMAQGNYLASFPRFAIEALGLLIIALLAYILTEKNNSSIEVIPLLGTLALGAQRLLPALQTAYGAWAGINAYEESINSVLGMLDQKIKSSEKIQVLNRFNFTNSIEFKNVNYKYPNENKLALENISFKIKAGERIGIIGSTGSGKSTLLDLIMGLLQPKDGHILIDNLDLYDLNNPSLLGKWRASIAHVPQTIYLADSSFEENIAFGIPSNQIDKLSILNAAKQAQIFSYIEGSQNGFNTFVGERGIRLSGGQRQRIGIARALYKKTNILIFDEATSALDTQTEEIVMNSIEKLSRDITIIMIAHRLTTVKNCDRVIKLENGKIQVEGKTSEVLSKWS
tara:strand:- start:701 stop:2500 length:1800 start_codon:yes stop_codon:yes gene_type:complete